MKKFVLVRVLNYSELFLSRFTFIRHNCVDITFDSDIRSCVLFRTIEAAKSAKNIVDIYSPGFEIRICQYFSEYPHDPYVIPIGHSEVQS